MINSFRFSVGIPAYKGRYLAECIASVLNQSYPVYELIIVNDCSPDPLDTIVAGFADERIKYFKNKENAGAEHVANNYNNCVEKAQGDYFVLIGDDDKLEPDYLEAFANLIVKYSDLDVFHCRSLVIDENSNPTTYTPSWPEYESVYDNIWHRMNGHRVQFIGDYVYRLSPLKSNGGFYYMPLGWYTDDITSYIAMGDKGIAHTNKAVFNYRMHGASINSVGNQELKMKAILQQYEWFVAFLKNKPTLTEDLIVYNDLCKNIQGLIKKEKYYAIYSSLNNNLFKNGLKWVKKRKVYNISISEIAYSVFLYFKIKRGEKKSKSPKREPITHRA